MNYVLYQRDNNNYILIIFHSGFMQGRTILIFFRRQFFPPLTEIQGNLKRNWVNFLKLVK